MKKKVIRSFQKKLITWYGKSARQHLPWRKTKDPYSILVSETMLQQTQVAKVIPYYKRFLKKFPTVSVLAKAPLTDVLETWSGLGYYSRAKNLHKASLQIMRDNKGELPGNIDELIRLPGVGRYTAGAVASIAFDQPAPILDGNAIRVLCRYFGIRRSPKEPQIQKKLWAVSTDLVPRNSPGTFNQALMEIGALVCTPRSPQCIRCPLARDCRARKLKIQDKIPLPRIAPKRKKISYVCGILRKDSSFLVARRPLEGLLPGLWEFPGGEIGTNEPSERGLVRLLQERLGVKGEVVSFQGRVKQILTHREIEIDAFAYRRKKGNFRVKWYDQIRWVPDHNLMDTAFTAGMSRVAQKLADSCALSAPGP